MSCFRWLSISHVYTMVGVCGCPLTCLEAACSRSPHGPQPCLRGYGQGDRRWQVGRLWVLLTHQAPRQAQWRRDGVEVTSQHGLSPARWGNRTSAQLYGLPLLSHHPSPSPATPHPLLPHSLTSLPESTVCTQTFVIGCLVKPR